MPGPYSGLTGTPPRDQTTGAIQIAAAQYDRDNAQQGQYAFSPAYGLSAVALAAGRGYAMRFVPSRALVIQSFKFAVSTAASVNDTIECALFDKTGNTQLAYQFSNGLLNSTGAKSLLLAAPVVLTPGIPYYICGLNAVQGGTAASISGITSGAAATVSFAAIFGNTFGAVEVMQKAAQPSMPANLAGFVANNIGLAFAVSETP